MGLFCCCSTVSTSSWESQEDWFWNIAKCKQGMNNIRTEKTHRVTIFRHSFFSSSRYASHDYKFVFIFIVVTFRSKTLTWMIPVTHVMRYFTCGHSRNGLEQQVDGKDLQNIVGVIDVWRSNYKIFLQPLLQWIDHLQLQTSWKDK